MKHSTTCDKDLLEVYLNLYKNCVSFIREKNNRLNIHHSNYEKDISKIDCEKYLDKYKLCKEKLIKQDNI